MTKFPLFNVSMAAQWKQNWPARGSNFSQDSCQFPWLGHRSDEAVIVCEFYPVGTERVKWPEAERMVIVRLFIVARTVPLDDEYL